MYIDLKIMVNKEKQENEIKKITIKVTKIREKKDKK